MCNARATIIYYCMSNAHATIYTSTIGHMYNARATTQVKKLTLKIMMSFVLSALLIMEEVSAPKEVSTTDTSLMLWERKGGRGRREGKGGGGGGLNSRESSHFSYFHS